MIERSTNIRRALRQSQRGFIINPFRFGGGGGGGNAWETAAAALGPVFWLRMSESSGNFLDASGNGYHGTPNNSPTRSRPAIYTNMGSCAGFQATNRSVSIADATALRRTGDVTIAVAIKRNGSQGTGFPKLLWKPSDYANGRCNWGLVYTGSTNRVFFRVNASLTYYTATMTSTIADATSYWLVGRRLGAEVSIWVNGVKEHTATLPSSGTTLDTSADSVWIGGQTSNANDQFIGDLDEPMMFNYGLSDSQIADLYAARA